MDVIKVGHTIEQVADFYELTTRHINQIIEENRTKRGPKNDSLWHAHKALRNEAMFNDIEVDLMSLN